ncbi:hypothetical protein BaRGS_00009168 [Batillaria attramentaria]|uniref:Uncharacterized protein n=1 Tax=Batillaria attramentaria TaxID=370345 RepID=A0ABD0LJX9_9CAEN
MHLQSPIIQAAGQSRTWTMKIIDEQPGHSSDKNVNSLTGSELFDRNDLPDIDLKTYAGKIVTSYAPLFLTPFLLFFYPLTVSTLIFNVFNQATPISISGSLTPYALWSLPPGGSLTDTNDSPRHSVVTNVRQDTAWTAPGFHGAK